MDFGEGMTTARCLTFSPDDRTAYIGTDDGVVALTKERRWRWKQDLSSPVWAVAVSGNGELAMTIRDDGGVRWFDGWTGRELGLSFFLHADGHRWVAWTDTGHFVSSEGAADLIKWDEDAVSSDQLYNKFYRPDVVREVIAKGEPAYKVIARLGLSDEVGAVTKKLPMVKISGIESGALASTDTLNVTVEATNTGGGLRNISLFHNGKRIPQDGPGQQRGTAQSLSYTVTLQPGENELKAQAANDAETSSTPAIVHVKFNGVQASSTLHLFTIGLNRYQNPRYNLTYCAADADASAEAFAKRAGGLFAEVKTHNLRDDQATKIAISEKFAELARSAKPQDVFIFCYAGHGVMGEKPEGKPGDNEFYLIPHDITRMYGDPTMLAEKGVSRKDLEDWCAKVPARKQLMLLDTCQSGGLVDAFAMRGVAEEKAIAQLARATGTVVIASTGAEAYARESKDIGHGIFTQVLLDGIAAGKADADKDGKITVKEIDAYINEAVPELSKKLTNTPQYPTSYSRGQDFPIGIVK